ncbi:MAG TPA: hydrogenase maturation protease [Acidimicrobiales bacterium]|nr:hydrogenase maturation protease [Acidimicrobiales bacterium]
MTQSARVVVAGIGNDMRHDDGAGALVAARALEVLGALGPVTGPGQEIDGALSSKLGEPLDLLGHWDDADLAIVVDAVRSGAPPGTLSLTWFGGEAADFQLDGVPASVAKAVACGPGQAPGTHGLGVVGVYRLARAMDQAPRCMVVLGIEGCDFSQGEGLSPSVAAVIDSAAAIVVDLVHGVKPPWQPTGSRRAVREPQVR